jgi:hypothetical protein
LVVEVVVQVVEVVRPVEVVGAVVLIAVAVGGVGTDDAKAWHWRGSWKTGIRGRANRAYPAPFGAAGIRRSVSGPGGAGKGWAAKRSTQRHWS